MSKEPRSRERELWDLSAGVAGLWVRRRRERRTKSREYKGWGMLRQIIQKALQEGVWERSEQSRREHLPSFPLLSLRS